MRRSVWNAIASNGGSVPLRADVKGTQLSTANILIPLERQLIALQLCADSFYIMKLCSRLLVLYCRNCMKDDKFRYLIPILKNLGAAYNLGSWLVGKPVYDFLFVIVERFSLAIEALQGKKCQDSQLSGGDRSV